MEVEEREGGGSEGERRVEVEEREGKGGVEREGKGGGRVGERERAEKREEGRSERKERKEERARASIFHTCLNVPTLCFPVYFYGR